MPIRLGPSYDRLSSASSLPLGRVCLACRFRGREMSSCCVKMGRAVRKEKCVCSEFRGSGIGIDKHGNLGPRFPMLLFRFPSVILQSYMIQCSSKAGKAIPLPENDTSTQNYYDSLKSIETRSTPTSASQRAAIQHTSIWLFLLLVVIMDCSYRCFVRMGRKSYTKIRLLLLMIRSM